MKRHRRKLNKNKLVFAMGVDRELTQDQIMRIHNLVMTYCGSRNITGMKNYRTGEILH